MIPVGLSVSTNILVGNNIGANNIVKAKFYARMCITCAFFWSVMSILVQYLIKNKLIRMFSSSESVNQIIESTYFLLAIFIFFDCMQGVGTGVIRGIGKQGLASIISIIGYWVIGIPVSIIGAYYLDYGMNGLWFGPTLAIIFNFTFYYIFILKTDWNQIVKEANERRENERKINA
jgi:MATE family multidrug resistance protein